MVSTESQPARATSRNEVGNVHRHLVNLGRIVQLNVPQNAHVLACNEVDRNTLASKSSRSADTVDVVLTIAGKVVVDDQTDLLDVDTTRPDISGDEHTTVSLSEVLHDAVPLFLWHVAVHAADSEVGLTHLVGQPVHLAPGVAEDDSLSDGQGVVEIAQGVKLPVLLLDGDEVLLETLEGQFVTLHKDADGVGHELGCHVEHIVGEGSRDDDDLGGGREVSVHVVDLLSESLVEQLIGFVENQHLNVAGAQMSASDHVGDTTRGSRNDVLAVIQLADVLADVCSSDAGMTLHVHVVAESHDDALNLGGQLACWGEDEGLGFADGRIDDLEHTNGESRSLAGSGLRLGNCIAALADLDDGTGLNSRGRLVTVSVDSTKKRLCQAGSAFVAQGNARDAKLSLTLQRHGLEGRMDRDLLGGVELHPLLGLTVNAACFSHVEFLTMLWLLVDCFGGCWFCRGLLVSFGAKNE